MVSRSILMEDAGLVSIGTVGEREFGRRNFMDVTSLSSPSRCSRSGGASASSARSTQARWLRGTTGAQRCCSAATPGASATWTGIAAWSGSSQRTSPAAHDGAAAGPPYRSTSAMRFVMSSWSQPTSPTQRRRERRRSSKNSAASTRGPDPAGPRLVRDDERNRSRWWTFGGGRANRAIAAALDAAAVATMSVDDLGIGLRTRDGGQ